jgi:gliding motility-associated-like protein
MRRILILLGLMVAMTGSTLATHIVGAELYYECINPSQFRYRLTLKMYRDCLAGQADYDNVIDLYIFNGATGGRIQTIAIPRPASTPQIQPTQWGTCVSVPPAICVEEGIYTTTVTLPPLTGGYDIGWSRCCRNGAISNIVLPLNEGVTFLAHVPDPGLAQCNNMPQFNQRPPTFLCANQLFAFDHSATDVDGDSLVYALTNPFNGLSVAGLGTANNQANPGANPPILDPFTNPMGPPPYQNLSFMPGFSFLDPFGSGNFNIDPQTGFITVTPTQTGIFVLAISVFEFRNGQLLSENKRDLQIHVIACLPQEAPPTIVHDLSGLNSSGDTIFVAANQPFCYPVTITDPDPGDIIQSFTQSAAFGNGTFAPPLATFVRTGSNPISGQICWTPSCVYNNQVVPLIIGARDPNGCLNVNSAFDTVWVSITAPANQPPALTFDLSGLPVNGDTVTVQANTNFCFSFTATDPNAADMITISPIGSVFTGPGAATVSFNGTNPVTGQVCWTPGCNVAGQVILIVLRATDMGVCNQSGNVQRGIFVKVVPPPNAPPVINTNLTGNVLSGDTILVSALNQTCFSFNITDPDAGSVLTVQGLGTIFSGTNPPVLTTSGSNPLQGNVCWTPSCAFSGQTIPIILQGRDNGICNNPSFVRDTVWVRVLPPPNAPPVITTNLAGNTFLNDTIFVRAEANFCYTFRIADADPGSVLTFTAVSPIFNTPNGPTVTVSGTNPINGQVCWTPSCDFVGQTIPLTVAGADDGACDGDIAVQKTIFIKITTPPNQPPVIIPNLAGLDTDGDTIFVDALVQTCYTLFISDPNGIDTLTPVLGPIFSAPNPATFTFTGVNPIQAQVCFTAECSQEGQVIPIVVGVRDNGACDNVLSATDTIFIKVRDPFTLPPVVGQDISELGFPGDTIYIEVNESFCYDFFVVDQTPGTGFVYEYNIQTLGGLNLGGAIVSTISRNDSLIGRVCYTSDCSNGGSFYRLIISARDEAVCPPFDAASDTVFLKVNTDFMAFGGRDTAFCEGTGGVQLSVTPIGGQAPYYYSWWCADSSNGGCGLSSTYIQNPVVNPTDTNTYFVQVTDRNGCTSEWGNLRVDVNRLPRVDAGPDTVICSGGIGTRLQCTILNPTEARGPYTYLWTPATGLSDPTSPNPWANPDTTTIYRVVVTADNGCSSDFTSIDPLSTVTVGVKQSPIVEAGDDQQVCLGDSVQFKGFAVGAGPEYTFVWTPAHGVADSSNATSRVSPPFTTTYSLVAWSNGCPSKADQTTVFVRTIPTLSQSGSFETCANDSVQLSVLAGGDSTASSYSFIWTPALGLSDSTSATPMASPPRTTLYQVRAVSNLGCGSSSLIVPVVVLPAPIASAGRDTIICRGDTVALTGSHVMRGGAATQPVFYRWSPVAGLSSPFTPATLAYPSRTTLYQLEVASGSCSSVDELLIQVGEPVSVEIVADTNRICEGDSVLLTAVGGFGSAAYEWGPADAVSALNGRSVWASPVKDATIYVTLTENVCSDTDSFRIAVNPTPQANYFATQTTGCAPLTVAFQEQVGGNASFIWDFGDGSPVSNEPGVQYTYTQPGDYPVTLTVVGSGGCSTRVQSVTVRVVAPGEAAFDVVPGTEQEIVLPDAVATFVNQSQGAVSNLWDFGDGRFSTDENPVHTYQRAGEYTVVLTITDAGGCRDTAIRFPVVIVDPDLFIPNVFSPNDDGINDTFFVRYTGKSPFSMQIFDRWGRVMFTGESAAENEWNGITDNGAKAPEGVYFYSIKVGDKTFTGNTTLVR